MKMEKNNPMYKKIISLILISIGIIIAVQGIYWLAIGIMIIGNLLMLFFSQFKFFVWFRNKEWVSISVLLIFVFLLAISIRVFLIEIYNVPSGSMEETLIPGDKVIVNKLAIGPRLPKSPFEIPWIKLIFYLNNNANAKTDSNMWQYCRLNGFNSVKRNDILVFNLPDDENTFFIKRCIGLPGDSLRIVRGKTISNGRIDQEPVLSKSKYLFYINNPIAYLKLTDSLNIQCYWYGKSISKLSIVTLTPIQFQKIKRASFIDSIIQVNVLYDSIPRVFPYNDQFKWTIDNFGPLYIPRAGASIRLDKNSFVLYQNILRKFEKIQVDLKDGLVYVNQKPDTSYTFRHNYYFMMGDNRHNSIDSRFWGLVPEELIVGKASTILFSYDANGIKWDRIFKSL